ncbi:MAG: hypothetical protein IJ557_02600 [Bacteroidaceae bacterium]|nr:hypothetical protein [Bacteroidaceae bacterium]
MKKMLFNRQYGLEQAVIELRKDMTRRMERIDLCPGHREQEIEKFCHVCTIKGRQVWMGYDGKENVIAQLIPRYAIGEEVAVAQSYKSIDEEIQRQGLPLDIKDKFRKHPGWKNKMFVRADLMPHHIRITDIRMERLQDITDEDCLREGIYKYNALPDALGEDRYKFISYAYDATQDKHRKRKWFPTPREAFAALIDKVSGRGTWNSNPWVVVYEFESIN